MSDPSDERGIDPEGFVREVFAAMREAGLEGPYAYDPKTGVFGDEGRGQIDVKQIYLSIGGHSKGQREAALKKVAEYYVERPEMPSDWAYAKPRILLTIMTRMAEEANAFQNRENPQPMPVARITEHVAFGLGFPVSIGTLNVREEDVERWGVEPDLVFRQAAANLERRSQKPWGSADKYPGVYGSQFQDGIDGCRMFFPRRFMEAPIRGKPVVVLATPHRMLFAGSEDEQGLVNLGRLARTYVEKGDGILFLRPMKVGDDGESWVDWLPPRTHPARSGLRWLEARQESMDTFHQGALIRLAAKKDESLRMALPELEVVEGGFGTNIHTRTIWSDVGETALPKADRIVLKRGDGVLGSVRWASLAAKFPLLLEAIPGYPKRYRASRFPEDWQLAMIGLDPADGPRSE